VKGLWGVFLCAAILLGPTTCSAAEPRNYPVEFIHDGDDVVGGRLAYQIKECIRKSSAMTLASAEGGCRYQLIVQTMPYAEDSPSAATLYSYVINIYIPVTANGCGAGYITSSIGYCGSDRVASCAESIVANLDSVIEDWSKIMDSYIGHQTTVPKR
jgi:hypothetical protein